jgi:predicted GH43/DUF377 family glycosyl hydrolase
MRKINQGAGFSAPSLRRIDTARRFGFDPPMRNALVASLLLGVLPALGCNLFNKVDPDLIESEEARIRAECLDGTYIEEVTQAGVDPKVGCDAAQCREFDFCDERSEEACIDERDNDSDGLVDCGDPGCALIEHCQEDTAAECADGIDNDSDGLVDCDDHGCWQHMRCLPFADMGGGEEPVELSPPYRFEEGFDAGVFGPDGLTLDSERWLTFSSDAADRPVLDLEEGEACADEGSCNGRIWLNGYDNWYSSGIVTTGTFTWGRAQPFRLTAQVDVAGDCSEQADSVNRCVATVKLTTQSFFSDQTPPQPRGVAGWTLVGTGAGGGLEFRCSYHTTTLKRDIEFAPPIGVFEVVMEVEPESGELVWTVDGVERCRSERPVEVREPASHLVMSSHRGGGSNPAGRLWFDEVVMEAEPETSSECRGLAPLFPDVGFEVCASSPRNTGLFEPAVAEGPDGMRLFVRGYHSRNHYHTFQAISDDGGATWALDPDEPVFPEGRGHRDESGRQFPQRFAYQSLVYNAALDRYESWVRHYSKDMAPLEDDCFMWSAPSGPGSGWERLSDVPVTLEDPPPGAHADWVPMGVALANGRYYTWVLGLDSEDRRAVYRAVSDDGVQWRADPQPALSAEAGGPTFEQDGITGAVATWTGEAWVMAYTGFSIQQEAAIGLAVSLDPEATDWVRYERNPIYAGGCGGLDDFGVRAGSVRWNGDGVTIWYDAKGSRPLECPDAGTFLDANFRQSVFRVDLPLLLPDRGGPAPE